VKGPTSRSDPEPALIRRAQEGHEDSLRLLLEEVTPPIQQWAMGLCRDEDDAADLVQEVLILLVRKLSAFRGDSRFLTWLYTVTRNQALDALRKRRKEEEKMERFGHHTTSHPPFPAAEERLDSQAILEVVAGFLNDLPQRQREVFQLADLQGLSSPEIGEILGIKAGGVRAALFKARRTIRRRILAQHPEFAEEYLS